MDSDLCDDDAASDIGDIIHVKSPDKVFCEYASDGAWSEECSSEVSDD